MGLETATVLAYASLAATAAGSYAQYQSQQNQADAQEESQDIQSAAQKNRARSQRRQQVREERIRRARILQSSENTGVSGSSSEGGALSSLGTQTGTNISSLTTGALAAQGISGASQKAADARTSGATASALTNMSYSVFANNGGFGAFDSAKSPQRSESAGLYNYEYFD